MAQRMESVAPPGGVMLSESTARLVEEAAVLGEPEPVRIKGADTPVPARRLLAIGDHAPTTAQRVSPGRPSMGNRHRDRDPRRGRRRRRVCGQCHGSPGIGKSRLVRESAAIAAGRGVPVFTTFCESHARDIPFHAVARLLRAALGVSDLDDRAARAHIRAEVPDADPKTCCCSMTCSASPTPRWRCPTSPDARRRRLTALVNAVSLARQTPGCMSWRTRTGSTRSANPCWPISWRSSRTRGRWC